MTFRRRARRLLGLLALAAAAATFLLAGIIVDHPDSLAPADAVYVLGGSRISRALEASELLAAGLAPRILISQGARESAEFELGARGIHVPTEGEVARDTLTGQLGVAASAVTLLPSNVDNTAQEALAVQGLVASNHWTRLIVLTDCSSTRRAGYAFRRTLGPSVTIMARCARTDGYQPWMWWRTRASIRMTFYEMPKLFAYWCGLNG